MTATAGACPVSAQSYEYDAASRLTSITQGAQTVTMSYDSASRRTSLSLPNGVQTSYAYDPASRVTQILHQKTGTTLENVQYQYDSTGSRTRYQRTSPHPPLPNEIGATFDPANEMLSLNGNVFSYDANGNLVSRTDACGTASYSWDGRNRLTGISGFKPDCSPLSASFKYDALGRRIEKTVNGQTTQYLYDGLDVAAEVQAGATTATYLRSLSIDEPFARTKGGASSYYLQDALGSVIGLADATGALATTYAYDAFGGTTAAGALSDQPFKYTGREDDGTGLYYYRARYYSPEMRRFISEDPIGLDGGDENYYVYVLNDPANRVDPEGESISGPTAALAGIGGVGAVCAFTYCMKVCFGLPGSAPQNEGSHSPFWPKFSACMTLCGNPLYLWEFVWDALGSSASTAGKKIGGQGRH